MKFNKSDSKKFEAFFERFERNIECTSAIFDSFNLFVEDGLVLPKNCSIEEMLSIFLENLDCEEELIEECLSFARENKCITLRKVDKEKFLNNPGYIALSKIKEKKMNNIFLSKEKYLANQPFLYDYDEVSIDFIERIDLGYFDSDIKFPVISKNNKRWMSVIPHEIKSMEKSINEAKGHVLTYGLGLGYFSYMCAIKDEVIDVTVIESDQNIIDTFNKLIAPTLGEKVRKIKIIVEDAYDFQKEHSKGFDYVFIDIYHDASDGLLPYIMLKSDECNDVKYSYWIEGSILTYLRRLVITYFMERYMEYEVDYEKDLEKSDVDYIMYLLNMKYQNILEFTFESFEKMLSKEGLIELVSGLI